MVFMTTCEHWLALIPACWQFIQMPPLRTQNYFASTHLLCMKVIYKLKKKSKTNKIEERTVLLSGWL